MKKILLLLVAVFVFGITFAQKPYNIEEAKRIAEANNYPGLVAMQDGRRVYFDPEDKEYLSEYLFELKYGRETTKKLYEIYKTERKNGKAILKIKSNNSDSYSAENDQPRRYKLAFNHKHTIIGTAAIGVAAGSYMIGRSVIDSRIESLGRDLADGEISTNDYNHKIESLGKTKRTMGYICGGVSIVGAIVVITGMYKDYDGDINLGHNFAVSDYGAGIRLTKRF